MCSGTHTGQTGNGANDKARKRVEIIHAVHPGNGYRQKKEYGVVLAWLININGGYTFEAGCSHSLTHNPYRINWRRELVGFFLPARAIGYTFCF